MIYPPPKVSVASTWPKLNKSMGEPKDKNSFIFRSNFLKGLLSSGPTLPYYSISFHFQHDFSEFLHLFVKIQNLCKYSIFLPGLIGKSICIPVWLRPAQVFWFTPVKSTTQTNEKDEYYLYILSAFKILAYHSFSSHSSQIPDIFT